MPNKMRSLNANELQTVLAVGGLQTEAARCKARLPPFSIYRVQRAGFAISAADAIIRILRAASERDVDLGLALVDRLKMLGRSKAA